MQTVRAVGLATGFLGPSAGVAPKLALSLCDYTDYTECLLCSGKAPYVIGSSRIHYWGGSREMMKPECHCLVTSKVAFLISIHPMRRILTACGSQ